MTHLEIIESLIARLHARLRAYQVRLANGERLSEVEQAHYNGICDRLLEMRVEAARLRTQPQEQRP